MTLSEQGKEGRLGRVRQAVNILENQVRTSFVFMFCFKRSVMVIEAEFEAAPATGRAVGYKEENQRQQERENRSQTGP